MMKLRHRGVWYCVQVYTGEEQSLESSPGLLKLELVTMPYTGTGPGEQAGR